MPRVKLGQEVKDIVSGYIGIAMGVTTWMYGCRRVIVVPKDCLKGKPQDGETFDEPQLEIISDGIMPKKEPVPRHGPQTYDNIAKERR